MKWSVSLLLIALSALRLEAQSPHPTDTTHAKESMINDSVKLDMQQQKEQLASQMAEANLTYFIIRVPDNKFGYTIFIDGQMYIEQKSIPAVSGNAGFPSKEDAEKVAKLVIEKIKQGEMPPTISMEDLQLLKMED